MEGSTRRSGVPCLMADRHLDNWLETFLEWTLPRSEAPESFLVWSGMFTIASVLKRRVLFPKRLLGSYNIYPNLYVIFVGPPGVVRKSTTAGYAESLISKHNERVELPLQVNKGPTGGSDSKLIEIMSSTQDGSLTVISSEFSSLVKTTPEAMMETLTDLFDNKREFVYATRMHGFEKVDEPCLNLLACTTPEWVSANPGYITGGGFASRVIFIFEKYRRQEKMYYDHLTWSDFEMMEELLVKDLALIAEAEGEFRHESSELRDEMEEWYIENTKTNHDGQVAGYYNRKHVHLHKIAMILSLCESDDLVITHEHFKSALGLLEVLEDQMHRTFAVVGRNPYSAHFHEIGDFIKACGPVTKTQIISKFWHDLQEEETQEILDALVKLGYIEGERKRGNYMYEAV